jgi:hypothetical protein
MSLVGDKATAAHEGMCWLTNIFRDTVNGERRHYGNKFFQFSYEFYICIKHGIAIGFKIRHLKTIYCNPFLVPFLNLMTLPEGVTSDFCIIPSGF